MADNDHDLLIEINTNLKNLSASQTDLVREIHDINKRVTALEAKDRGDSEKTRSITKDVQESLSNSKRIDGLITRVTSIEEWVKKVEGRTWQIWLAILTPIIVAIMALVLR